MRFRPRKYLTRLSLLACTGLVLLWIISLWNQDELGFNPVPIDCSIVSSGGSVEFNIAHDDRFDFRGLWEWNVSGGTFGSPFYLRHWHSGLDSPYPFRWRTLGFGGEHYHFEPSPYFWHRSVTVPYWLLAALAAFLPALSLDRRLRLRRLAARGLCAVCRYDLRASRDRCPECGTPIVADYRASHSASCGAK